MAGEVWVRSRSTEKDDAVHGVYMNDPADEQEVVAFDGRSALPSKRHVRLWIFSKETGNDCTAVHTMCLGRIYKSQTGEYFM